MNTKTTKFLAVLAVLAMAFAVFAAVSPSEEQEAADQGSLAFEASVDFGSYTITGTDTKAINGARPDSGAASATTYLANALTVGYAAATESSIETYTLTGSLGANYFDGTIGMGIYDSAIVFNKSVAATHIWMKWSGDSAWKDKGEKSAGTEAFMIGITTERVAAGYFLIYEGASAPTSDTATGVIKVDVSGLSVAKTVTTLAELKAAVSSSAVNTILINAGEAIVLDADLSTTKPIYFKADYGIKNGTSSSLYKITANLYTKGTGENTYRQTAEYFKMTNVTSEHGALEVVVSDSASSQKLNLMATVTANVGLDIIGTMELTSVAGISNSTLQLFNGSSPKVASISAGSLKIVAPEVDGPVAYTFTDATATLDVNVGNGAAAGQFLKDGDSVAFNTTGAESTAGVISIDGTFIIPAGATVTNNAIIKPADTDGSNIILNYGKLAVGDKGSFQKNTAGFSTTSSVPGQIVSSRDKTAVDPSYYKASDILINLFGANVTTTAKTSGDAVTAPESFNNDGKTTSVATITVGADAMSSSYAYSIYGGTYEGDVTLKKNSTNVATLNLYNVNYTGTITGPSDSDVAATAVMKNVKGSLSITAGSIAILGEWDEGTVTIDGKAKLTGDLVMKAGTTLILNEGAVLYLDAHQLTIEAGAKIQGYGKINAAVSSADDTTPAIGKLLAENSSDVQVDVTYPTAPTAITVYTQIATAVLSNDVLVLGADITIPANQTVTLPQGVTLYTNGWNITIDAKGELDVTEAKILRAKPVTDTTTPTGASGEQIIVNGSFVLNTADVKTEVIVGANGYTSVSGAITMKVSIGSESVSIGYGNTLVIEGVTFSNKTSIDVFGNLEMSGNNAVANGATLNIYEGAVANIEGKLDISGIATVKGKLTNEGEITVKNSNGGAKLVVSGRIINEGKVTIQKAESSGAVKTNDLEIAYAATTDTGLFINYSELVITGTMKGVVDNFGTLTFNGTAGANAKVRLYDGQSVQATSVTGELVIYDDVQTVYSDVHNGKDEMKANVGMVVGNSVTLQNVKQVVVSESVTSTVKTIESDADDFNVKVFVASMTVSTTNGSLLPLLDADGTYRLTVSSAAAGTKTDAQAQTSVWGTTAADHAKTIPASVTGKVTVNDMALGKRVQLALNGTKTIAIAGDIVMIAEKSDINNTADKAKVTGSVTIGPKAGPTGNGAVTAVGILHSGSYTTTDSEANVTSHYMPLDLAISTASLADDNKVFIVGSNTISTDVPVDAKVYVSALNSSSSLTIGTKGVMTIAAEAQLDMSLGTTSISGKLIIMDKNTGLKQNTAPGKFVYEVYTENGNVATYTGVMGALEDATSGTKITIQQDAYISESTVIKEGVTLVVPKNKTLTIGSESEKVVLTVNGELDIESAGVVNKLAGSEDIAVVINGVVASNDDLATSFVGTDYYDDYAMFESKLGGKDATYLSNMTYAAENCTDGDITIKGDLAAGLISIVPDEKSAGMRVLFVQHTVSGTLVDSTLTVVSMTLGSPVIVNTANGSITGNIVADSADEEAIVSLKDATGIIFATDSVEDSEGVTDYLYVQGDLSGTMEIVEGVVTLNGAFATINSKDSILKVDTEGVLVVASGKTMTIANVTGATSAQVTVPGGILVNGTLTVDGLFNVAGAMTVVKDKSGDAAKVDLNKNTTITGVLLVSDDEIYAGEFNINSVKLTLGTAAKSVGAEGAVIGPITIKGTGYICLFEQMDISEALINWNSVTGLSEAVYTDIYVNGTLYVTAFALEDSVVIMGNVITTSTKISGLNIADSVLAMDSATVYTYWFTDAAMKTKLTTSNNQIGDKTSLYFGPAPAVVKGTVTVGIGLTLYVDGKTYNQQYWDQNPQLTVGIHEVMVQTAADYDDSKVSIKFNGAPVSNGKITVTADMDSFTLVADGATPYTPEPTPEPTPEKESEWNVTTILLLVLVILIAIMAVIVALRLNRS